MRMWDGQKRRKKAQRLHWIEVLLKGAKPLYAGGAGGADITTGITHKQGFFIPVHVQSL